MEHLSSLHDNTVSNSFFSLDYSQPQLSQSELNQLLQRFQSTIDIHELVQVYFNYLKEKLQVMSISVNFSEGKVNLGEVEEDGHTKTLSFLEHNQQLASLSYSFKQAVDVATWRLLQEYNRYFKAPLKNALAFFKLKQAASKDHLTNLGNRAAFDDSLQRLLSQSKRKAFNFSILVIDMDKFKQVNDTFGHQEGDKVLIATADILTKCLRDTDYAFRFGGDEFCCLLPDADAKANELLANRIRQTAQAHPLLSKHQVTCSIGTTSVLEDDSVQSMFERADSALYQAKQAGRNCIQAA